MPRATALRLAAPPALTRAEGPGLRLALWVQGCPRRCTGCCNPAMLPRSGGQPAHPAELLGLATATRRLRGLTLLGGEPFLQAAPLAWLAARARRADLDVLAFTGHTLERLRRSRARGVRALLAEVDCLVDGPYLAALRGGGRPLVGSTNQRVIPLSRRGERIARALEGGPAVVELEIRGGSVRMTGAPGFRATP
jgi:anaerobic ribonucleoside-triphosphate reductase activating protein